MTRAAPAWPLVWPKNSARTTMSSTVGTSNRATAWPGVPTLKLSPLSLDGQHVTGRLSVSPHLRVADAVLACAHSRGATTASAHWVGWPVTTLGGHDGT